MKVYLNMTKRQLISLSTSVALLATVLMFVPYVSADSGCAGQYGNASYGTTECPPNDVSLDKKVINPITGIFVDNLLAGDAAYSPDSEVVYSLNVTNSSNQEFTSVQVTDTLPDQMTQPQVHPDDLVKVTDVKVNGNELKFVLKDALKAGESREIRVKAKVKSASNFDSGKNLNCDLTNKAVVTASDRTDSDEAKLCVQTNILGKTTLPTAGPEDYLPLVPFVATGFTGMALFLRRPAPTGAGRKSVS